ncbi:YtxH domain-containing protein [Pullulanibacillus sp. KACC 23026]|uniref:YtxH domain-containing protein n=1 Tax=Pullulanibacillus sp. KACC 23026 TaxID=3028315 RepID=UPI0023B17E51|nr:YtxH domain-containing protein [Pullulanibacillus sp. KACC 23026]WEG12030.1 YtxH domain-containing protein [Pullulanibacillus sp. KACC 23026]
MGKAKSFLLGFTFGSVAAASAVLLSTPKAGKQFRTTLKDKVGEMSASVDDIKNAVNQAKENINDLKTKGMPLVRTTVNDVKELVDTWKSQVQPHLGKLLQDSKSLGEETKRIPITRSIDD